MITCLVVDDERPARELIEYHLRSLSEFVLLASFENAIEAFNFLQKNDVDLIFLDVQMPGITGLDFIKSIRKTPRIILTTAYRDYAVEAFDLDVFDYLMKPVTSERFMKAISKFNSAHHHSKKNKKNTDGFTNAYLFLKTGWEQTKVYLQDILYVEGLKDYVKVHTNTKTYIAGERLSYMEQKLPEHKFIRIHKSFIVALDQISQYNSDQVSIGQKWLPIGRVFKNEFFKKLQ